MKQGKTSSFFRKIITAMSLILLIGSCEKENLTPQEDIPSPSAHDLALRASTSTTHSTSCFSAIAQVNGCAGEWIRFSGEIVTRETRTVDGMGRTHITRNFTVQNLTGVGVTVGSTLSAMTCAGSLNGQLTGNTYTVAGGAEMFNIHFSEGGTATPGGSDIFIHRGTLVFVSDQTSEKIVAKHIIRKVNGVIQENTWECS